MSSPINDNSKVSCQADHWNLFVSESQIEDVITKGKSSIYIKHNKFTQESSLFMLNNVNYTGKQIMPKKLQSCESDQANFYSTQQSWTYPFTEPLQPYRPHFLCSITSS